ncbi:MAG: hypothetical protein AB1894_07810 [Chloroflexota bacterium]
MKVMGSLLLAVVGQDILAPFAVAKINTPSTGNSYGSDAYGGETYSGYVIYLPLVGKQGG